MGQEKMTIDNKMKEAAFYHESNINAPFCDGQERFLAEQIKPIHYDLLEYFLNELIERMASRGCCDWGFPENWSKKDKENFCKLSEYYNRTPEEYDSGNLSLQNWQAVSVLSDMLKSQGESARRIHETMKKLRGSIND